MKYRLTYALIIVNIVIFEVIFSMPDPLFKRAFELLDFSWPHALELWRWVTSMFMHANASHLFFNMLALYFFGRVLEDEAKPRQWLTIYFISGLAGNLFYGFSSSMPAVGASGCIFGIMGAAMLLKPKELIRIYVIPLPLGFIAILYMLTQATLAAMPAEGAGIAYMAHIGGLVAGSLLMFLYKPKNALKGVLVMLLLLGLLLLLWPLVSIVIGIGGLVMKAIDFAVGIVLYGLAKLLLSWIW